MQSGQVIKAYCLIVGAFPGRATFAVTISFELSLVAKVLKFEMLIHLP